MKKKKQKDLMEIKKISNFIESSMIQQLYNECLRLEFLLYEDYSDKNETFNEFIMNTQKETELSRSLSYRLISTNIGQKILNHQISSIKRTFNKNFLISPLI